MISFLLFNAGFLNLLFYIFAIGFVISLGLEQWLKFRPLSADSTMNIFLSFIDASTDRGLNFIHCSKPNEIRNPIAKI